MSVLCVSLPMLIYTIVLVYVCCITQQRVGATSLILWDEEVSVFKKVRAAPFVQKRFGWFLFVRPMTTGTETTHEKSNLQKSYSYVIGTAFFEHVSAKHNLNHFDRNRKMGNMIGECKLEETSGKYFVRSGAMTFPLKT